MLSISVLVEISAVKFQHAILERTKLVKENEWSSTLHMRSWWLKIDLSLQFTGHSGVRN